MRMTRLPARVGTWGRRLLYPIFFVMAVVTLPVLYNPYLRAFYVNIMAQWAAKVQRPRYTLIGDSITAGGGNWGWRLSGNPLSAINFGTNGSMIRQIAAQSKAALALRPKYLLIEGGVNDAEFAWSDSAQWGVGMETLAMDARRAGAIVVLTLTPPVSNPVVNHKLDAVRARLRADFPTALCVDLAPKMSTNGVLDPRYTIDGVHFNQAGYRIWAAAIRETIDKGIRCTSIP